MRQCSQWLPSFQSLTVTLQLAGAGGGRGAGLLARGGGGAGSIPSSVPKGALSDAAELSRFAIAALAAGEADLAAQHLRGALAALGR